MMVRNCYHSTTPDGESDVFCQERELLGSSLNSVRCTKCSDDVYEHDGAQPLRAVAAMPWSRGSRAEKSELLQDERADFEHFRRMFPSSGASGCAACRDHDDPVVQVLHDNRTVRFIRDVQVLGEGTAGNPCPAVRRNCCRDSLLVSLAMASTLWRDRRGGVCLDLIARLAATGVTRGRILPELFCVRPPAAARRPVRDDGYLPMSRSKHGLEILREIHGELSGHAAPLPAVANAAARAA